MVFGKGNGNWLPKAVGKTLEPSRAWSRKRVLRAAADAMVRLGEAGIAALRAFFGTKRGTRQLIESSQEKLVEYFADKGTPARQLPLDIPPPDDQEELSS